jgi:hypothetical protein
LRPHSPGGAEGEPNIFLTIRVIISPGEMQLGPGRIQP